MKRVIALAAFAITGCTADVGGGEDCGVSSDPSCVEPGDSCDELPAGGLCDGELLYECRDGAVAITDCALDSLHCGAAPGGVLGCATGCALLGVDDAGICSSASELQRCVDGEVITESCAEPTRCIALSSGPQCQSAELACRDIGPQGRCDGDVLVSCASGWPAETDCAASGEVCAYASDAAGYQCSPIADAGARRVSGRVDYQDRPVSPGAIGDLTPAPVRGANVYLLRDSDDSVLAHAVTANDGSYTLRTDADAGTSARVTVTSSSQVAVRPLRVTRSSGNSHAFGSDSISLADDAEDGTRLDILITESSQAAPAFNIFDRLIAGMDYARSLGAGSISPLTARWQRGSAGGSYYQSGSNFLHIAGGSDDDGYDDVVILHEFGHYHQDEYGDSDNPGGPHPSSGGDDPRLAWGEGQATYIAMVLTGQPYYIDTNFQNGGWFVELEDNIHDANLGGSMSQFLLEWMVAELLWDVGDSRESDGDADPMTGDHDDVMKVTTTYFHDPAYVGRGAGGVDLVDWLDGWFWQHGLASCASMQTLVHDVFEFPYDFDACN